MVHRSIIADVGQLALVSESDLGTAQVVSAWRRDGVPVVIRGSAYGGG